MKKDEDISLFLERFGDSPQMRVLEFFIEGQELDFAKSDVAEGTNLSRQTLYKCWDSLIKNSFIVFSRRVAKTELFKLKMDNPVVENMINIFNRTLEDEMNRIQSQIEFDDLIKKVDIATGYKTNEKNFYMAVDKPCSMSCRIKPLLKKPILAMTSA